MKKILSLVIAMAMLFSLSILPVNALDSNAISETAAANKLYELGLFKGVGVNADGSPNYALNRVPTRNEAIVMLIRLFGKEEEALSGTWETPFTDLDSWAAPYIGYAYANKLAAGTSNTTFSGEDTASAAMYLTFVLRALGYSSKGDFQYEKAADFADNLGITHGEYSASSSKQFLRGNIAKISYSALFVNLKDSSQSLFEYLGLDASKLDDSAAELTETTDSQSLQEVDTTDYFNYWTINGDKVMPGHAYMTEAGTYTVELFYDGAKTSNYTIKDVDSTACSATKNADGTMTVKYDAKRNFTIKVLFEDNGSMSPISFTYNQHLSGLSLIWHGWTITPGKGFGSDVLSYYVADVYYNGEKISDYTVKSYDQSLCDAFAQSDGTLCIKSKKSGKATFTLEYKGKTASFNAMTYDVD